MEADGSSRRTVLESAGVAGVAGLTASLAGCTGGGGDESDVEGATRLGDEVPEIRLLAPTAEANPFRNELAALIVDNWGKLGFEVEVAELEFDALVDRTVVQHEFDASLLGWGGTLERIDPHTFLFDLHHSATAEEGRNAPGWENDEYDDLVERQVTQVDEDERQRTVHEAQAILAEAQPRTYVANEGGYHPYAIDRVSDVDPTIGEGLNSVWNLLSASPTDGDTLRVGHPAESSSMNPMRDLATPDRQFVRLVYDPLYRLGEDGFPTPWLAADEPEIDDDGRTYTVEIRDDARFHDDEELTIDDVAFTYDLYADSQVDGERVAMIDEIDAGGGAITFHLTERFAPFTATVLGQAAVLPEHVWDDADPDDPAAFEDEDWTGSGPFQVADWERGDELRLEAFDDHFVTPTADALVRVTGEDTTRLVDDLEAGRIDMVGAVPQPPVVERLRDDDGLDLAAFDDIGYAAVEYNTRREPFDDVRVRRALSRGVPKEAYVELVRDGMGTVTQTTIAEHNAFWHNPDVEAFHENLDAAEQELAEGGYGWDDHGRLHYGIDR